MASRQGLALAPGRPGEGPAEALPVFVHSSFRVSSTWLWSKFRRLPDTVAYYEVFHPALAHLRADGVGAAHSGTWTSHHPSLAPYFLEFLPLLKPGGGVAGYDGTMELDRFIPADGLGGELSPEELAYVETLIRHARAGHKVPVLTFTRSLGRAAAMRRAVEARHVFLHRNLFHQWASYSGQFFRGNDYFLRTIGATLEACRHDPFLASLGDIFTDLRPAPDEERTFTVFLLLHLYLYGHAVEAADVVVDVTAIAADAGLRRSTEVALSRFALGPIDLSDAQSTFEMSLVATGDRARFIDTVEQFSKLITSTCPSGRAAGFVLAQKDAALDEWDRHDRHTRTSFVWYHRQIEALHRQVAEREADRGTAENALSALGAERDGLAAGLAAARAARDEAVEAGLSLAAERDVLAAACATAQAARDAAEAAGSGLAAERDGLAAALAAAEAARDRAEAAGLGLAAERDGLAIALAAAEAARDVAEAAGSALALERDGLTARVASLAARGDGVFGARLKRRV